MHTIVTDLGFGDAGKGATVDWLCSQGAQTVVRVNGGCQAAHNVHVGRQHHTFSLFGSGTFAGAKTLLAEQVVIEPSSLVNEADALGGVQMLDRVKVDPRALVTTPAHWELNRWQERARGAARHGSCGRGVGTTMDLHLNHAVSMRVGDLYDPPTYRRKMEMIFSYVDHLGLNVGALGYLREWEDRVRLFTENVELVDGDTWVKERALLGDVVFEGAQGVLLDETHGFHPHTTWSTTTSANAVAMCQRLGLDYHRLGLLRTYTTRHGAGPLPGHEEHRVDPRDPHNVTGEFQGSMRATPFQVPLHRYALAANGGVDSLAISHVDLPYRDLIVSYGGNSTVPSVPTPETVGTEAWEHASTLRTLWFDTLDSRQFEWAHAETPDEQVDLIRGLLGKRVSLLACGPDRSDRKAV